VTSTPGGLQAELRRREVELACTHFRPGCRILELGGGDGFQATVLAGRGFEVDSIDVPFRQSKERLLFPVLDYDGRIIPFADGSFDAVFSSNVLEHIPDLKLSLSEIRRVLKPEGVAVHVLPTPVWRFWTTVVHYPWLVTKALDKVVTTVSSPSSQAPAAAAIDSGGSFPLRTLSSAFALGFAAHGEYPNAVAELHHFRRSVWEATFRESRFEVTSYSPSGLFYTGQLLIPKLPISARASLSAVMGSSCHVFTMRVAA